MEEILIDLASDINSWGKFYMISAEESRDLADEFYERLEMQGISSLVIVDDMDVDLNEYDALLAISKGGMEDNIISMVKNALRNNVKVYGICTDFRSPLSMFCDESIIIKENDDFEDGLSNIFNRICEILLDDIEDEEYKITDSVCFGDVNLKLVEGSLLSPLQGMIIKVNVDVGDVVRKGDVVCIIEAMKMENEVCSDKDGIVEEIFVKVGDFVTIDDGLILIK